MARKKNMKANPFAKDVDATTELPQLDIKIISAALERMERPGQIASDPPAAPPDTHPSVPDWQHADQVAELQDKVASLQAALTASENKYSRLSARHETLLQKLHGREARFTNQQQELTQALAKLTMFERQRSVLLQETTALRAAHDATLLKLTRRNRALAANELVLSTAQKEIERLSSDSESLKRLIKLAVMQRDQRDEFIIKQAREIKRLRALAV